MVIFRELGRKIGRFYGVVFLITLVVSLSAEVLLFAKYHIDMVSDKVSGDFSVVLTLKEEISKTQIDAVGEKLKSNSRITSVEFESKKESLSFLRQQNPKMAGEIDMMEKNSLPDFFIIKPAHYVLPSLKDWLRTSVTSKIEEITGAYYAEKQNLVILQTIFYGKFLMLAIGLITFLISLFAVVVEFISVKKRVLPPSFKTASAWVLGGIFASLSAVFIVWIFSVPLNTLNPNWWIWPPLHIHLAVVFFSVVFAWALFRWKNIR